jgi:hypothetical protein
VAVDDRPRLAWRRAAAMHLDERLPAGSLEAAAWGGLQDTAPRAGLLSLHARVEGVGPSSWEDPSLAQIWFRGGADYIVPRRDLGVFTLGASPRDATVMARINELADRVVEALDGARRPVRDVVAELGLAEPLSVKTVCPSGRLLIRWDASRIDLVACERPGMDPEEARLELARRFLTWLGPGTAPEFAKWAAVSRPDAEATFRALGPEVDELGAQWRDAPRPEGVRLLPLFDPFLATRAQELQPPEDEWLPMPPVRGDVTQRLLNSLAGRILLDGEIVGAWGRVQHKVTLFAWRRLSGADVDRTDAEAASFSGPIGRPVVIRWLGG